MNFLLSFQIGSARCRSGKARRIATPMLALFMPSTLAPGETRFNVDHPDWYVSGIQAARLQGKFCDLFLTALPKWLVKPALFLAIECQTVRLIGRLNGAQAAFIIGIYRRTS